MRHRENCLLTYTVFVFHFILLKKYTEYHFSQFSRVLLFATPWTAARQASLSITNSWSSLKLMSIESVMPSNHLILCCPPLLLPSVFPSIRSFPVSQFTCNHSIQTASHLELVSLISEQKVRTRISTLCVVLNKDSEMHRSLTEKFGPRQHSPNSNP